MRRLHRIGALFSEDALGYWRALYVLLLVVWSASTIWRVVSGSLLDTPDTSPTLIKIGLLEAVAFLAAWSLLLITLTTKVVNKGRDLEYSLGESTWKFKEIKAEQERHEEDFGATIKVLASEVSQVADRMRQLTSESEQVREENERLRGQLKAKEKMAD